MIKEKIEDLYDNISFFLEEHEDFFWFLLIVFLSAALLFSNLVFNTDNIFIIYLINILQLPAIIIYVCAFAKTIQWIICKIFKTKERFTFSIFSKMNNDYIGVFAAIVLIFFNVCTFLHPDDNYDGVHCYNVSVISDSGMYTLPAEIKTKSDISLGNQHIGQKLYLSKFYWPNGGYCYFHSSKTLKYNQYTRYVAQDGREYYVKPTKEKNEHEKIIPEKYKQKTLSSKLYKIFFFLGPILSFWHAVNAKVTPSYKQPPMWELYVTEKPKEKVKVRPVKKQK